MYPSYAIIDSQSVKTALSGEDRGIGGSVKKLLPKQKKSDIRRKKWKQMGCKRCGGCKIKKNGKSLGKQRYNAKNVEKHSSIQNLNSVKSLNKKQFWCT